MAFRSPFEQGQFFQPVRGTVLPGPDSLRLRRPGGILRHGSWPPQDLFSDRQCRQIEVMQELGVVLDVLRQV